jgi:hypothetical protein
MTTLGVWTDVEGHVGLWCGCFPAMQPILRILSYRLGIRSQLMSKGTIDRYRGAGDSKSGTKGLSSGNWRGTKNGYMRNGSGTDGPDDSDSTRAITESKKGIDYADDVELNEIGHGRSRVVRTTKV